MAMAVVADDGTAEGLYVGSAVYVAISVDVDHDGSIAVMALALTIDDDSVMA